MDANQMVFDFRQGARPPANVTPQRVAEELQAIEQRRGRLTPATVADDVETAGQSHYLSPFFTWDERQAVRKLHEIEARHCISVVVVTRLVPQHQVPVRAFVAVRSNGTHLYEPMARIIHQPDKRRQLVDSIQEDIDAFTKKMREVLALINLLP